MNHISDAVKYMSEKIFIAEAQTNAISSEFRSRTSELEHRVFELEKQVRLLLELNNGSVNLESMIREEVLKVLSNR